MTRFIVRIGDAFKSTSTCCGCCDVTIKYAAHKYLGRARDGAFIYEYTTEFPDKVREQLLAAGAEIIGENPRL